jgi:hypothetical protein
MKEERMDRTDFAMMTFAEADDSVKYWLQHTPAERIHAAYLLSLRAFGYAPENEPRLDRTLFSMRKMQ